MTIDRNISEGFFSILGGRIGVLLLSIILTPILVRLLGPDGYGDYAYLMSLLGIMFVFTRSGVFDGLRKHLAESHDSPDWDRTVYSYYLRMSVYLWLLITFFIVTIIITGLVRKVLPKIFEIYLVLLCLLLLIRQVYAVERSTLMGYHKERVSELLLPFQKIFFIFIGLPLIYVNFGVLGALVGEIISWLIITILSILAVSNVIKHTISRRSDFSVDSQFKQYILYNTILMLMIVGLRHVDILMVRPLLGDTQTGYYKASLTVAHYLWIVPASLQAQLLHSTSKMWVENQMERISNISSQVTRYNIIFTGLVISGLFVLTREFITIYFGKNFLPAVLPALILLPGAFGFAIARPIYGIGQGSGNIKHLVYFTAPPFLSNIVLNYVLIPRFEISGAALATSISYGMMMLTHVIGSKRMGYNVFKDLRLIPISITVITSVFLMGMLDILIVSDIYSLLIIPPIGTSIYVATAIFTGALSREELRNIMQSIQKR